MSEIQVLFLSTGMLISDSQVNVHADLCVNCYSQISLTWEQGDQSATQVFIYAIKCLIRTFEVQTHPTDRTLCKRSIQLMFINHHFISIDIARIVE